MHFAMKLCQIEPRKKNGLTFLKYWLLQWRDPKMSWFIIVSSPRKPLKPTNGGLFFSLLNFVAGHFCRDFFVAKNLGSLGEIGRFFSGTWFNRIATFDGSNPKQPPGMYKKLVNNGINYQPQLVRRISSINSSGWLNQPIWKICSSNWIMNPQGFGAKKYETIMETVSPINRNFDMPLNIRPPNL